MVVLNNLSGATPVFTATTLAPGTAANFTGSYTAPASGNATSTSTASAASLCGVAVANSASSTCPILTAPGMAITQACPPAWRWAASCLRSRRFARSAAAGYDDAKEIFFGHRQP